MKIKRYAAPDMRAALRAVQQEQGPDAVILSSQETADGIELVAAVDYDEALIRQAARGRREAHVHHEPENEQLTLPRMQQVSPALHQSVSTATKDPSIQALEQRMQVLQDMMQDRFDKMSASCQSSDAGRQAAWSQLERLGLEAHLIRKQVDQIPEGLNPSLASQRALDQLSLALPTCDTDPLRSGGAIALLGPTGVGKTTTAAKLAARHILKYGQGSVQFVGTDEYRIGAQEQLAAFGRILGAPLHRIHDGDDLRDILRARQDQELVLVDTAGIGGRDLGLHQQFEVLRGQRGLRRALCLSAATGSRDLKAQARRFAAANLDALILTKMDETTNLGSALSFVASQRLAVVYTTDGQQVPEDLHWARAEELVARAIDHLDIENEEAMRACA